MIKPETVAASITRMLNAATFHLPSHLVREGVLEYLVARFNSRDQLNAFIRILRARMRDKLKDGVD
jgi:hypothetical protein